MKKQLLLLIRAGAFNFTNQKKKILLWEAHMSYTENPISRNRKLFFNPQKQFKIPQLEYHKDENIFDQLELLGFPIESPFNIIGKKPKEHIKVKDMHKLINQEVTMIGYFVFRKTVSTIKKKLMYFGTFLDENGNFLDTTHFPNETAKYPFKGYGIYLLKKHSDKS